MSWDLSVYNIPHEMTDLKNIPDDFVFSSLGERNQIILNIKDCIPNADFTDPTWGIYQTDKYKIEFNMGDEEECTHIMIHVRGSEESMLVVQKLLKCLHWRGIDMQTGSFFDLNSAKNSFSRFNIFKESYSASKKI